MAEQSQVSRLLKQITADADNLRGVVIGYVRNDGTVGIRYSPMTPAELAHLSRILDTKIDREYSEMLFPAKTSPVAPAPMHSTPVIEPEQRPSTKIKRKRGD